MIDRFILVLTFMHIGFATVATQAADSPAALPSESPAVLPAPRIDWVVMTATQPHADLASTIWYDDFDGAEKPYTEAQGPVVSSEAYGGSGRSMLSQYDQGSRGVGNRKVLFGDSPSGKVVRRGESFDDVYWRIYVKHQVGWQGGGPDKLSRATSMTSPNWTQAMISHVWSSGEALTLDPATGVKQGEIVTSRYNDFDHLRWLGNRPASRFLIHSTDEAGRWVCVEARAKLNSPGKKDGINQLWIDGRLEAERVNLDWRGDYDRHGINAVFLESYWNDGSPVTQSRWMDNLVVATEPIGPVVCPKNPTVMRTPYQAAGQLASWQLQAGTLADQPTVVWSSKPVTGSVSVRVDAEQGDFSSDLKSQGSLTPDHTYQFRVRQTNDLGNTSDWSPWHQAIRIAKH